MNSLDDKLKLFMLNNIVINASLTRTLIEQGIVSDETPIEKAADDLIGAYVAQFSFESRVSAKRMAEHYELFHMLESDIRTMIEETLSASTTGDWWETLVPEVVRQSAKKSRDRELNEGITLRSARMIDYTTFGELAEIIKANWSIFAGVFSRGSILAVEKIMARLNTLRGPIAHCGTLSEDEVLRLKLTVRDWFRLAE